MTMEFKEIDKPEDQPKDQDNAKQSRWREPQPTQSDLRALGPGEGDRTGE